MQTKNEMLRIAVREADAMVAALVEPTPEELAIAHELFIQCAKAILNENEGRCSAMAVK